MINLLNRLDSGTPLAEQAPNIGIDEQPAIFSGEIAYFEHER